MGYSSDSCQFRRTAFMTLKGEMRRTLYRLTTGDQILHDIVTHVGDKCVYKGSGTSPSQGLGPALPNFWDTLFMRAPFDAERPNSAC